MVARFTTRLDKTKLYQQAVVLAPSFLYSASETQDRQTPVLFRSSRNSRKRRKTVFYTQYAPDRLWEALKEPVFLMMRRACF